MSFTFRVVRRIFIGILALIAVAAICIIASIIT